MAGDMQDKSRPGPSSLGVHGTLRKVFVVSVSLVYCLFVGEPAAAMTPKALFRSCETVVAGVRIRQAAELEVPRTGTSMLVLYVGSSKHVGADRPKRQAVIGCLRTREHRASRLCADFRSLGAVAELVGIEGGVVSGVFNLESSGVEALDWRPRHDEQYHEA